MKKDHPASHFSTGSKETLTTPDGRDETLQNILREFRNRDYGAENIIVGIQV